MRNKYGAFRLCVRFSIILALSIFMTGESISSHTQQSEGQKKSPASQTAESKATENQKSKSDAKSEEDLRSKASLTPQEKKRLAKSLIEETLAGADQIRPVQYGILAQVEGALLLMQFDKDRSISILRDSLKAIRALLEEKGETTIIDYPRDSKERRLWASIIRKIASVSPDLIDELLMDGSYGTRSRETVPNDWTEESRAIMAVAMSHIEDDPALASRLAERSLYLGQSDWMTFLDRLSKRDKALAEQLAVKLIDLARDSSFNPISFSNMRRFMLAPERSLQFKDYFFQSVVIRLRREVRPDISERDLEAALSTALGMSKSASTSVPRWQPEFDHLVSEFELIYKARSLPLPGPTKRIIIDMSSVSPAKPGDTQEISDALLQADAIKDPKARDKEYQNLAFKAALNANEWLAEEIMSRISDERIRSETTLKIYGPLVRKAMAESDWPLAQKYALKVRDPLGRTLMLDRIGQTMLQAKVENVLVRQVYDAAMSRLDRDRAADPIAKAFLLVAKSLYPIDPEGGASAINAAISVLNELTKGGELQEESLFRSPLETWIPRTSHAVSSDEVLQLNEMIGNVLRQIAKRDTNEALIIATGLTHQGLEALAHLAISKELLEETKESSKAAPTKKPDKQTEPPAPTSRKPPGLR